MPEVLRRGRATHRHFVVTFDDAYTNIAGIADFLGSRKVVPTVFVNGAFCEGRPYFRVLAALLRDYGGGPALRAELASLIPNKEWSEKSDKLFDQTKDQYVAGLTETAVAAAYNKTIGVAADLRCHLDAAELLTLRKRGWQIGNHTWEHLTLSALDDTTAADAIERNAAYLKDANLEPLDWLSYPNGLARHVSAGTKAWLDRNPTKHGLFAGGGINLFYSRTQWLRISLGNPDLQAFRRILAHNAFASSRLATYLTDNAPTASAR